MMMKKIVAFLMTLLMLTTLAGCGNTSEEIYDQPEAEVEAVANTETEPSVETADEQATDDESEETATKDKVTFVLDWLPNTNHTGIYTAIEKGYYDDVNLEVEVIQPSEGSAEALVASGQADFGVSFQETILAARTAENPIPVVAVATIIQNNTSGFAGLAEKGINSPKDFEGKIYGSWGTEIETAFIKTMMAKEEADYNALEVMDIVSWDFMTSISTDVDFQWIYYGWDGIAAEQMGIDISFIKLQDIDERLNFYTPLIFTSEAMITENPELISRFLEATAKGYEYAVENPEDAVKDLLKHAPETDADIALASQIYLADEYVADSAQWGVMEASVWQNFSDWMYENQVLTTELDVEKAYTNEFLPAGNE